MKAKCVLAAAGMLVLPAVSMGAIFEYEWAGGNEHAELDIGDQARVDVFVTLTHAPFPPFLEDEVGFFLYILSEKNDAGLDLLEPVSYANPHEPGASMVSCSSQPPMTWICTEPT